jgi:hypothetical protein
MIRVISLAFLVLNLLALPAAGQQLATRWAAQVNAASVHPEYPRPQLVRSRWQNLNGRWRYTIQPREVDRPAESSFDGEILVPFAVESALSGVSKPVGETNRLWYRRTFVVPDDWRRDRVVLQFGAVDWEARVWVNGREVGAHQGGYTPFSCDITGALTPSGEQELVVSVWDPTDAQSQPRGKQVAKPRGIWYTSVTGIWQTVWLEPVPASRIERVRADSDIDSGRVQFQVVTSGADASHMVQVTVRDGGQVVGTARRKSDEQGLAVEIKQPKLWSPASPHLYDLRVELLRGEDVIDAADSYFGMRKIEAKADTAGVLRLFLNNQPLFQFGPLDQGWWPDGLYTAPNDEALRYDIEITRDLGCNMCRKHVKVEPARWYYWADKLGLLVWQDMPSGMATGKPESLRQGAPRDVEFSADQRQVFQREWQAIIDSLSGHPSIVVWVPFNEGWGQHNTNEILRWTKQYDPSRLVDGPSGWEDRQFGDLKDLHRYPGPGMFPVEPLRVSVLGEFGGLGLPLEGHTWLDRNNWGYRTYKTQEELLTNYERLIQQLPPLIADGLAAAVYTQTTDVEIEVNGLLTYDRAVIKMPVDRLTRLHQRLYDAPRRKTVLLPTSEKQPQSWRFTTAKPPEGWEQATFDDRSWRQGEGGFGTAGTPGAVVRTVWDSSDIWLRREFSWGEPPQAEIYLRLHHDEDTEVYLNGRRIAFGAGFITQYAELLVDAALREALRADRNVLAIHCRQTGGGQYIDAGLVGLVP